MFTISLDDNTMRLLMEAAEACRCPPRDLIESILRDVLIDDAIENRHIAPSSHLIH